MPVSAPKICQCGKVVSYGERCPCRAKADAERKARFDKTRPSASARGYGRDHREAAALFLARPENRVCKWPGCKERATAMDHIIPHRGDESLRMDPTNWQGLCQHHHNSAKQRADRRRLQGATI
jgi:5-methylcytosine-specific restriction protein A